MSKITTSTLDVLVTKRNLKKVMFNGYMAEKQALESLFNKNTSDALYEEWVSVAGTGQVEEKAEGDPVVFKTITVLDPKRIYNTTYALGIRATMEAKQDERYGILGRLAEEIGRKHAIRREIERSMVFNGAFTTALGYAGYDGRALIDTAHPITGTTWTPAVTDITAEPTRTATTVSNELATSADLSYSTIIDLITLLMRTVDESGDYIGLTPKGIVVSPEQLHTAKELLGSSMRPDTANNVISSINGYNLDIVVSPHILDIDSTLMYADRHDLQWFDRMPLKIQSEDEFTTGDELHKGVQRFGLGFADWRGWVGTQGA